jgi:hypothetical protein
MKSAKQLKRETTALRIRAVGYLFIPIIGWMLLPGVNRKWETIKEQMAALEGESA